MCSSFSIDSSREDSSELTRATGTPVDIDSTSAMSSSSTTAAMSRSPDFQACSFSERSSVSLRSTSRSDAAFSKSCSSMADSLSRRTLEILSSRSRSSGGLVMRRMRRRAPASSMRSIALSGRNRSLM